MQNKKGPNVELRGAARFLRRNPPPHLIDTSFIEPTIVQTGKLIANHQGNIVFKKSGTASYDQLEKQLLPLF